MKKVYPKSSVKATALNNERQVSFDNKKEKEKKIIK